MIDTTQKKSIYERVDDFYFVVEANSRQELSSIQKLTEAHFSDKRLHFVVVGGEDLHEELKDVENTTVLTKKSTNLLGKWKQSGEMRFLENRNEKVVVYFCTESNKIVNKLRNSFQHATHIGYMSEKMTNFDISFRVDTGNENELLDQVTKYLKRL